MEDKMNDKTPAKLNDNTIRFTLTLDEWRFIEKALDMSLVLVLDRIEDEYARELMRQTFMQAFAIFEEGLEE